MRINRFYSPTPLQVGIEALLDTTAAAHAIKVLRLPVGSRIALFDGNGGEYLAELIDTGKRPLARIVEHQPIERESPLAITLVQAIARGERMDYTVQKAVEMGVKRIVPVISERSVVKLDASRAEKKHHHWQGVIRAACEQCGRNRLPAIDLPITLADFLAANKSEGLRLVLNPLAKTTVATLEPVKTMDLLIGPEGGFSETEMKQIETAGFTGLRFGPRILRTETAGVAVLGALQALWGDLS
ncbi:MAG TPA: 16S rRNA (uracil(1498)-N(3))-methyltransferase [Gammaproteobacteria bacterium]|nr:16S rRNA (uracil(1498)-N(3))-methyltransferase [Gammaproteobacteria bacterium]